MPHSLLEPVFEILCFGTGAAIIKIMSFGKIGFYDSYDKDQKPALLGFKKTDDGKIKIAYEWATLTGILFWILVFVLLYSFWPFIK